MQQSTTRRSQRLADGIQRELGIILLEEIQDPRLELVSLTGVRMNKDLSIAEVLYTHTSTSEKKEEVAKAFLSARGYLRKQLGKRLHLKKIPELRFTWDEYLEEMIYEQPHSEDRHDPS